jgi:hypothetical protein
VGGGKAEKAMIGQWLGNFCVWCGSVMEGMSWQPFFFFLSFFFFFRLLAFGIEFFLVEM